MRPFYLSSLLILLCSCSCIREIPHPSRMEIATDISGLIEKVSHVRKYSPDMGSGESFLYLLPQGIPFSIQDVICMQKGSESSLSDRDAIDRLYLASQLIDLIFVCDSTVHLSAKKMIDMDIEDKDLYKLTSPTYNGTFLYSAIHPLIADSSIIWSSFDCQSFQETTIEKKGNHIHIQVPYVRATGKVATLMICRPWLQGIDIVTHFPTKKIAIVDGIILSESFSINVMNEECRVKIYKKNRYKIIQNPISTHIRYSNTIIGYYCRVL